MSGPYVVDPKMQNAADSAYARQIWWEAAKVMLSKDCVTPNSSESMITVPDNLVKSFIQKCEQGFFDVKRESSK